MSDTTLTNIGLQDRFSVRRVMELFGIVRRDKVREMRAKIQGGTADTQAKLDAAMDAMLDERMEFQVNRAISDALTPGGGW